MTLLSAFFLVGTALTYNNCAKLQSEEIASEEATNNDNGNNNDDDPTGPGTPPPGTNTNLAKGSISQVLSYGEVKGVAKDPNRPNEAISVTLYVDGPKGTGTRVTSTAVVANQLVFGGEFGGNHGFTFQLPNNLLDGKLHDLYLYAVTSTGEVAVGTVFTFISYRRQAKAFFDAITFNCNGCHVWKQVIDGTTDLSYAIAFDTLATPKKANGGTRNNNQFVIHASGGNNHAGGNRCAGNNLCDQLRTWWDMEFGSAAYPSTPTR